MWLERWRSLFGLVDILYPVLEGDNRSRFRFSLLKLILGLALTPSAGIERHGVGMDVTVVAGGLNLRIARTFGAEVVAGSLLDVKTGSVIKDIFLVGDDSSLLRLGPS